MKPTINFIFNIGHRCFSPDFLETYKLRKIQSPFDFVFIDYESALKAIATKFADYLYDIVFFNKNAEQIVLYNTKNTADANTVINPKFYELLKQNVGYMAHDYNGNNLFINQNYLDAAAADTTELAGNTYNWNTICMFLHHNVLDPTVNNVITKVCETFNYIIDKYCETTALLYITKIITCDNISIGDYMNYILQIKKKYDIKCYIIVIFACDNIENTDTREYYYEEEKTLFILKKVDNYETQYAEYGLDTLLDYENEYNVITKYFDIELTEPNDI